MKRGYWVNHNFGANLAGYLGQAKPNLQSHLLWPLSQLNEKLYEREWISLSVCVYYIFLVFLFVKEKTQIFSIDFMVEIVEI